MTPNRPYRALRAAVGTVLVLGVAGLWARAQLAGDPLGTLWDVVMLVLVAAAGIAVFGRRTFGAAVESAQEIRGEADSDTEGGGEDEE